MEGPRSDRSKVPTAYPRPGNLVRPGRPARSGIHPGGYAPGSTRERTTVEIALTSDAAALIRRKGGTVALDFVRGVS